MAKTGRPRKGADPKGLRSHRVRCYLTATDLHALDVACGLRGLTRSDTLRLALRHWITAGCPLPDTVHHPHPLGARSSLI